MKKGFFSVLGPALGLCFAIALAPLARGEVAPEVLTAQSGRIDTIKKISAATLAVFVASGDNGGSGVVISRDGYALSNYHVTSECGNFMKCGMADGKLYDAVIVGIDPTGDVALIKLVGRDDFPCADLGDSDASRVGDWVYVVGNPFLLATDFRPTVTYGVLSGVHRYQYPSGTILEYSDCLQCDAAINPGNSGGPMFNAAGQLIGINGRGSFEKRGRVNVGVGYAISINQIKNFLGMLKSGRVGDHPTLGANVSSDEQQRAVVSDILHESDAARRGLAYDDEIISLGGRQIRTVNDLKNVLGIFPKDWRIPLEFIHEGQKKRVLVRLNALHRDGELEMILAAQGGPPRPPRSEGPPDKRPDGENPLPKLPGFPLPRQEAPPPEAVAKLFQAHRDFANFYFNQANLDRVWKAFLGMSDYAEVGGVWTLVGALGSGEQVEIELSDLKASYGLGNDKAVVALSDDVSDELQPPRSGGLLVALSAWRKLLIEGPAKFGDLHYLGTAPVYAGGLPPRDTASVVEADVLMGDHWGVRCKFYFSPADNTMLAMEMFSADDRDPCEIYFSDYRLEEGLKIPHRIEVRHGDVQFGVFQLTSVALKSKRPVENK